VAFVRVLGGRNTGRMLGVSGGGAFGGASRKRNAGRLWLWDKATALRFAVLGDEVLQCLQVSVVFQMRAIPGTLEHGVKTVLNERV